MVDYFLLLIILIRFYVPQLIQLVLHTHNFKPISKQSITGKNEFIYILDKYRGYSILLDRKVYLKDIWSTIAAHVYPRHGV